MKLPKQIRRFIKTCFIFSIPVFIFLGICEYLVRTYGNNPYKYKHNFLSENAQLVDTLILGNSHTYYGINPEILGSHSFNLANVSQIFKYDYLLLTNYNFKNLKAIILPISYCSFFDTEFEKSPDWQYAINYKIYMDINIHSDFSKYNFEVSRFTLFQQKLRALLSNKEISCDSTGMGQDFKLSSRSHDWEETGTKTANIHYAKDWNAIEDQQYYAYKIAEYCKQNGIDLILTTTPTWHTYYENLDKQQYKKFEELIVSFKSKYDLKYFNHLKDTTFQYNDFYDTDHLNEIGANKFTKILKTEINGSM